MAEVDTAEPLAALHAAVACPACRGARLAASAGGIACPDCGAVFAVRGGVPSLIVAGAKVLTGDEARLEFWDEGWKKRFGHAVALSRDEVRTMREKFRAQMEEERYASITLFDAERLAGKRLLNVGCGAGEEGLLFSGYGADYIGIDFSPAAASLTTTLIAKAGWRGVAYQAEAERLPIATASIDYVYTNGVLHHTPDTADTMREIHRVLKPGGIAVIGLYATNSAQFLWYRLHAILHGRLTHGAIARWLDAATEGEWRTAERVNQLTKTYTRKQFAALLRAAGFSDFTLEQSTLLVRDTPVMGRIAARIAPGLGTARLDRFGMMLMATCRKM